MELFSVASSELYISQARYRRRMAELGGPDSNLPDK
jgi:hypothetical protein